MILAVSFMNVVYALFHDVETQWLDKHQISFLTSPCALSHFINSRDFWSLSFPCVYSLQKDTLVHQARLKENPCRAAERVRLWATQAVACLADHQLPCYWPKWWHDLVSYSQTPNFYKHLKIRGHSLCPRKMGRRVTMRHPSSPAMAAWSRKFSESQLSWQRHWWHPCVKCCA